MSTLTIGRVFSIPETSPYDQIKWTKKTVAITDDRGKTLFEQKDIEAPESWTDLAVKIVASNLVTLMRPTAKFSMMNFQPCA